MSVLLDLNNMLKYALRDDVSKVSAIWMNNDDLSDFIATSKSVKYYPFNACFYEFSLGNYNEEWYEKKKEFITFIIELMREYNN